MLRAILLLLAVACFFSSTNAIGFFWGRNVHNINHQENSSSVPESPRNAAKDHYMLADQPKIPTTAESPLPTDPCSESQFKCRGSGKCLDSSLKCNGHPDCSDASDEFNCNNICPPSRMFRCKSGRCIPKSFVCDGSLDCIDNSDELDCPTEADVGIVCSFGEIKCKNASQCIPKSFLCDGSVDCIDSSDEDDCKEFRLCSEQQYQCKNGVCIPQGFVCDGSNDCAGGEDEEDCKTKRCESNTNHYQCKNGACVTPDKLCNSVDDCGDNSDEGGKCSMSCKKDGCSHDCFRSPHGPHCTCPVGYGLSSETQCSDVNECRFNISVCDHLCENNNGSYKCSCANDYSLDSDGYTCRKTDRGSGFLLVAMNTEIREVSLDETFYRSVFKGSDVIQSVTYDPELDEVYWSTSVTVYKKERKHQTMAKVVISNGIQRVESLSLDWYGRNLYIADSGLQKIIVCPLRSEMCAVLIDDLQTPRAMQLDIRNGMIFWTDIGKAVIEKAGMDGSHRQIVVSKGIGIPNGLALDPPVKRVYWMDANNSNVEHVDYNGNDRKHLPDGTVEHPFSMAVWENLVYWSDLRHEHVRSCRKLTGKDVQTILRGSARNDFYGLTLYHSSMIDQGVNPCSQTPCSHLCLLSKWSILGYKCACPVEMELSEDKFNCQGIASESSIFIVDGRKTYQLQSPRIGRTYLDPKLTHLEVERIGDCIYNPLDESMIVTDTYQKMILKVPLDSGHVTHIIDSVEAVAIAFDWLRNNLYWIDGENKTVGVVPIFGFFRTFLEQHYANPTDIAVDPVHGFMFVTDPGKNSIIRCGLDGRDCKRIIYTIGGRPMSVVVNRHSEINRIYWTDVALGLIESAALDGSSRKILQVGLVRPISLLQMRNLLIWTLEGQENIFISSGDTNRTVNNHLALGGADYGVRVLRLAEVGWQVPQSNVTSCLRGNGGCAQLCLGNETHSEVCACAPGYKLADDGKKCNSGSCSPNNFLCKRSGSCIPLNWRCNVHVDCPGGEDEENCPKRKFCSTDEFSCSPGVCISGRYVCDGTLDCSDGSDEDRCEEKICPSDHFKCKSGQCILGDEKCNRIMDCMDGSDEEGCPCNGFTCSDGFCIMSNWVCDGFGDCHDDGDEKDCPTSSQSWLDSYWSKEPERTCSEDEISCSGYTLECVPDSKRCDGHNDCLFGDDEEECGCREDQFKCKSTDMCIPNSWKCNGEENCPDSSDELGCPTEKPSRVQVFTTTAMSVSTEGAEGCGVGKYECKDSQCIDYRKVCDGWADCSDGSDEWNHCYTSCSNAPCQHECRTSVDGFHCSCRKGFILAANNFGCEDEKECDEETTCSHYCEELKGSFRCSCMEGYALEPDRRTCKSEVGKDWALLVGVQELLNVTAPLQLESRVTAPKGLSLISIDYDPSNSSYMYTDVNGSVVRTTGDGMNFEKKNELLKHCSHPHGVSVDYVRQNFYFSEFFINPQILESDKVKVKRAEDAVTKVYSIIRMCNLDEGNCTQIYRDINVKIPFTSLSLEGQKLFYCTNHQIAGKQGQINMANLDGTGREVLREKVVQCGALAVDEPKKRVYWTDTDWNKVQSISWDTKDHRFVADNWEMIHHPIGLTLVGNHVMWFNKHGNKIVCCPKYFGSCQEKVIDSEIEDFDFRGFLAVRPHRKIENVCEGGNCSQLCTVVGGMPKCMCSTGYEVSEEDPTACVKVETCPGNPCGVGICELLSTDLFVCRCPDKYSGLRCEVKLDALIHSSNAGTIMAVIIVLLLLIALALGLLWYKRKPFIIWKSKGRRANQTSFRFSNPAFGVMSDTPIVGNSPAPSSCPSQSNNPAAYAANSTPNFNAYDINFSKVDENQVNISVDSAVASGTDSTSVNIATHQVNLQSPIPPPEEKCMDEKKDLFSPYNPQPR